MAEADWLIVLGSNADSARRLAQARIALAGVGEVVECGDEVVGVDVAGRGAPYRNQWLLLRGPADAAALRGELKAIEHAHGRTADRTAAGICDLDLDLLARIEADAAPRWLEAKSMRVAAVRAQLLARFGSEPAG